MEVIRRGAADIANVYVTEAGGLLNASAHLRHVRGGQHAVHDRQHARVRDRHRGPDPSRRRHDESRARQRHVRRSLPRRGPAEDAAPDRGRLLLSAGGTRASASRSTWTSSSAGAGTAKAERRGVWQPSNGPRSSIPMPTPQPEPATSSPKGCVLTMDARRTIIAARRRRGQRPHDRRRRAGEREILKRWRAPRVIDARGAIVHPGFIDAHLHVNAQTCRGYLPGGQQQGRRPGTELRRLEGRARSRGRAGGDRAGCRRDAPARHHDVRRAGQRVRAGRGGGGGRRPRASAARSPTRISGTTPN